MKFDTEKTDKVVGKVIDLINDQKLTLHEAVIVVGKLLYSMGAQFEGYKDGDPGPTLEEIRKKYYAEPNKLGTALIMTGLTIQTWLQDIK